ncbi:hypothetical protein HPB48_018787 [Haemaphysalis longicornis]|uniref:Glycosyltransferase family 92 protein n=1 Tax=Haemaphysalis longicornis TaxID=44386 RepID=A0A9J6G237_HAELO|nr:hypothetical protein HPB48_018787 [Haemaphysalis longicornis]
MSRPLLSLVGRMQAAQWDVTLVPFKLPPPWNGSVDPQGWGEAAALADCAFRSRLKTEYFIHLDFEELMIVGDYNGSLTALIEHVERKLGKNNVSTLLAESRRFCYEYGLDEAHLARRGLPFRSMLLRRHSGDLGDQTRTAFIARSSAVCAAGDPSMVRHRGAAKELQFVASVLRTHRYVRCCDRTAEPAGRIGSMNYKYPESTHVALTPSTFIKKYKDRLHGLLLSIQLGKAS